MMIERMCCAYTGRRQSHIPNCKMVLVRASYVYAYCRWHNLLSNEERSCRNYRKLTSSIACSVKNLIIPIFVHFTFDDRTLCFIGLNGAKWIITREKFFFYLQKLNSEEETIHWRDNIQLLVRRSLISNIFICWLLVLLLFKNV